MKKIIFLIIVSLLCISCTKSILSIEKQKNTFLFELEIPRNINKVDSAQLFIEVDLSEPQIDIRDIDSAQLFINLDVFESKIDLENEKIVNEIPVEKLFTENQSKNIFQLTFKIYMKNKKIIEYRKKVLIYKRGKVVFMNTKGD